MATMRITSRGDINVTLDRQTIDVTSDRETADESWRYTDKQGHEHRYNHGYPTLDFIVDAEHWCDGTEGMYNHDPHMVVDEAHYECKLCGQTIKPGIVPPGWPRMIAGPISAEITGTQSSGRWVRAFLKREQVDALRTIASTSDLIQPFLDGIDEAQVVESRYTSA